MILVFRVSDHTARRHLHRKGNIKFTYDGEYNKDGLLKFMDSPGQAAPKPKEEVWADTPSDVVHLTDANFDDFVKVSGR